MHEGMESLNMEERTLCHLQKNNRAFKGLRQIQISVQGIRHSQSPEKGIHLNIHTPLAIRYSNV